MSNKIWNWWDDIKYYATQGGLLLAMAGVVLVVIAIITIYLLIIAIVLFGLWKLLVFLL